MFVQKTKDENLICNMALKAALTVFFFYWKKGEPLMDLAPCISMGAGRHLWCTLRLRYTGLF